MPDNVGYIRQAAALPLRQGKICLITSSNGKRWIIPKGWPQKGKAPHRSAAREAFEEAGVTGAIRRRSIGSFSYEKRLKKGALVECEVLVFALRVKGQNNKWPERKEREVKWLSAKTAAKAVRERQLGEIIRRLGRRYAR